VDGIAVGLATVLLLGAAGCAAAAWRGRLRQGANAAGPLRQQAAVAPKQDLAGSEAGWLRAADAATLLQAVHAADTLEHLQRQSRLAAPVWERDLLPALHAYAQLVQLMPASESHHHAHAGGLLAHTLEVVLAAATWRNGCLLPQGAPTEQMDAQRDHWTYVVFFAALLHDVGKPLTDLRIEWRRPGHLEPLRWLPMAGSLVDCRAQEYRVGFAPKGERDYTLHQRLAVLLLQRVAPASALSFLAQEPQAMQALTRFLQGEDRDSSVAQLVRRADQASTARAVAQGSRARFATAQSVPLAELLTTALRDLLHQGTQLPLNRDGAAGWVYDGCVWFVAKRVADQVREHLNQHLPDEGIPGEQKNDRLFDAWQEYGCIIPNPTSQQAIWYVKVHGEDASGATTYSHSLTMLRFALNKLWDDPAGYPAPMAGRIEVLASRKQAAATGEAAAPASAGEGNEPKAAPVDGPVAAAGQEPKAAATRASKDASVVAPIPAASGPVRAPVFRNPNKPAAEAAASAGTQARLAPKPVDGGSPSAQAPGPNPDYIATDESASAERRSERRARSAAAAKPAPKAGAKGTAPGLQANEGPADAGESRATLLLAPRAASTGGPMAAADEKPDSSTATSPVLLTQVLPALPGAAPAKVPPPLAVQFMKWLQAGLANHAILYNNSAALVHFVPQGLAIVSPRTFKQFADEHGDIIPGDPERAVLTVQREVLRAGWHVPAGPGGNNIHQFAVRGRGGVMAGRLAAVVFEHPHRWVQPVPPPNPAIAPLPADPVAEDISTGAAAGPAAT
jgi:integrating conjugative element relaxase (TIGR03760 family)